uniref:Uncharacterized protein n=1 Tax=Aegilops tauschii subsp. strangulata TaxID=200361 RepID=A0A453AXI6_AEGTS
GFFYVLLAYQVKSTMDGCRAEQAFSTVLHHSSGLAIGLGLKIVDSVRFWACTGFTFVRLYKIGL